MSSEIPNLAKEYAEQYAILPQSVNESDEEFRYRVAFALSSQDMYVAASEVLLNKKNEGQYAEILSSIQSQTVQIDQYIKTAERRTRITARVYQGVTIVGIVLLWIFAFLNPSITLFVAVSIFSLFFILMLILIQKYVFRKPFLEHRN